MSQGEAIGGKAGSSRRKPEGYRVESRGGRRLLTPSDLMELLQVSRSTVHYWAADGTLPAIILNEGERKRTFRFDPEEIDNWLKARRTKKQT